MAVSALPVLAAVAKAPDSHDRAVFTKAPRGANGYSTDAILLGNGDVTMAISSTPPERDSKLKQQRAASSVFGSPRTICGVLFHRIAALGTLKAILKPGYRIKLTLKG
jgi:hypothetical protein